MCKQNYFNLAIRVSELIDLVLHPLLVTLPQSNYGEVPALTSNIYYLATLAFVDDRVTI